jgi:hypothetical protein
MEQNGERNAASRQRRDAVESRFSGDGNAIKPLHQRSYFDVPLPRIATRNRQIVVQNARF